MDECFKCGIFADRERLYDAISSEGIIKICSKCSKEEDIPIIRKPTTFQLKEAERKQTVYDRLSKSNQPREELPKTLQVKKHETTLRDLVDAKVRLTMPQKPKPRPDLVENFHWVIMRARRRKKLSYRQLAEAIRESETVVAMAEKGILPEDDYRLINKLEGFLGIELMPKKIKKEIVELEKKYPVRSLSFDPQAAQNLTISDLKEMKRQREAEIAERPDEPEEEPPAEADDDDVSDEEIDDLIFRRR